MQVIFAKNRYSAI